MKPDKILSKLPTELRRYILATAIPLTALIFVVMVSRPMQRISSTAQITARPNLPTPNTPVPQATTVDATPTPELLGKTGLSAPTSGQVLAATTPDPLHPLAGRRIGLDPGHGPLGDMGAILENPDTGKLILSEAELNLDLALRTKALLVARGADVVLTRENADTFTAPWPVDANGDGIVGATGDELQERVDILNNFHAEVFLSIHANGGATEQSAKDDLQVLYCGSPDCPFPAQSKELARTVFDHLKAELATVSNAGYSGGALDDLLIDSSNPPLHIFVLGPVNPPRHVRATAMPGVLAESLYVTSPSQAELLNTNSARQAIAHAYAGALEAYLLAHNSTQK